MEVGNLAYSNHPGYTVQQSEQASLFREYALYHSPLSVCQPAMWTSCPSNTLSPSWVPSSSLASVLSFYPISLLNFLQSTCHCLKLASLYRWRNWGTEGGNNVLKFTGPPMAELGLDPKKNSLWDSPWTSPCLCCWNPVTICLKDSKSWLYQVPFQISAFFKSVKGGRGNTSLGRLLWRRTELITVEHLTCLRLRGVHVCPNSALSSRMTRRELFNLPRPQFPHL